MLDLEKFIPQLHDYIARSLHPLQKQIADQAAEIERLKAERPERGEKGDPGISGKSLTADDVLPLIETLQAKHALELERRMMDRVDRIEVRDGTDGKDGINGKDGNHGTDGRDGKDADEDAIVTRVLDVVSKAAHADVQKAIAAIPVAKDGRDGIDGKDGSDGRDGVDGKDGDPGTPGSDGKDGADVDEDAIIERVLPLLRKDAAVVIERAVVDEVAKVPWPQDGKDGRDGTDGVNGSDGTDGLPGEKGMDGRDGKDVTMEMLDESISKYLKPFTAKLELDQDRIELDLERRNLEWRDRFSDEIKRIVDSWPKPKDGKDGIGVKDTQVAIEDGGRWVVIKRTGEDGIVDVARNKTQVPVYRETWKQDAEYDVGDLVTWDGSTWHAQEPSKGSKPGSYSKAWKLIVKKGRDGK